MLSEFSKEFNLVIIPPTDLKKNNFIVLINAFMGYLSNNGFIYYAILHDRDTDESGILKTLHYHFVICCDKRCRASTLLNKVADVLSNIMKLKKFGECFPVFLISIDKVYDLPLSVQYLVHKNDSDKFQYNEKEVFTNQVVSLVELMNINQIDFDDIGVIIDLCRKYPYELDLIAVVGIKKYLHYKYAFDLVRQDMYSFKMYGNERLQSAKDLRQKVNKGKTL